MINLVVALQSEARPFITHFGLRTLRRHHGFRVYLGDGLRLIVTGIGKRAVQEACARVNSWDGSPVPAWLNVGIAGHRELAVGTGVRATRIIDQASTDVWHPAPMASIPGVAKTVCTLQEPDSEYPLDVVYDMEASAYYAAVNSLTPGALIQCYKVISDNRKSGLDAIDAPMVAALLAQHVEPVAAAVSALAKGVDAMIGGCKDD